MIARRKEGCGRSCMVSGRAAVSASSPCSQARLVSGAATASVFWGARARRCGECVLVDWRSRIVPAAQFDAGPWPASAPFSCSWTAARLPVCLCPLASTSARSSARSSASSSATHAQPRARCPRPATPAHRPPLNCLLLLTYMGHVEKASMPIAGLRPSTTASPNCNALDPPQSNSPTRRQVPLPRDDTRIRAHTLDSEFAGEHAVAHPKHSHPPMPIRRLLPGLPQSLPPTHAIHPTAVATQ